MSGIIFNGVELKEGQNIQDYINEVVKVFPMPKEDNIKKCYKCGIIADDNTEYYKKSDEGLIYICSSCLFNSVLVRCLICDLQHHPKQIFEHMKSKDHKTAYIKYCDVMNNNNTLSYSDTSTDSDTDSDTETDDSDSDTDGDTDEEVNRIYVTHNKKLMLTTKRDMLSHDKAVNIFNSIHDIKEKGSNGGHGSYYTNADTIYDLNVLPKLKTLYNTDTKKMKINNTTVYITFINVPPTYKTIPQQTLLYVVKKAKQYINNNKQLNIRDPRLFGTITENKDINKKITYNNTSFICETNKTVLRHNGKHYKVIQTYKDINKVKVRALTPHKTITHIQLDEKGNEEEEQTIYKIMNNDTYGPNKIIKDVNNYSKCRIDDYLLYIKHYDYDY